LIVSGGGGGGQSVYRLPGNGGGFSGTVGTGDDLSWVGLAGNQTSGYLFGQGQSADMSLYVSNSNISGAGGGWYGGYTPSIVSTQIFCGSGGGSGYIGNSLLTNKVMYCYNCTESSDESTKTISTTNVSETPISNYAKIGNGYARITLIS